jgi:5-methylcytosine-specific restriction endonuclease McrA
MRALRTREEYWKEREAERKRQEEQRRYDYEAYPLTPEWADIRKKIFKRANGICEGCGTEPAEQVHHLTYEHCRNEFLWELVAVCRHCHLSVHGVECRYLNTHNTESDNG